MGINNLQKPSAVKEIRQELRDVTVMNARAALSHFGKSLTSLTEPTTLSSPMISHHNHRRDLTVSTPQTPQESSQQLYS